MGVARLRVGTACCGLQRTDAQDGGIDFGGDLAGQGGGGGEMAI